MHSYPLRPVRPTSRRLNRLPLGALGCVLVWFTLTLGDAVTRPASSPLLDLRSKVVYTELHRSLANDNPTRVQVLLPADAEFEQLADLYNMARRYHYQIIVGDDGIWLER